jgi:hypothetical protein
VGTLVISSYQAVYNSVPYALSPRQALTLNNPSRLDNVPSCGFDVSQIALHSAPTQ